MNGRAERSDSHSSQSTGASRPPAPPRLYFPVGRYLNFVRAATE